MSEKLTIQERVKLVFMFAKDEVIDGEQFEHLLWLLLINFLFICN